jgi:hypothetical protein
MAEAAAGRSQVIVLRGEARDRQERAGRPCSRARGGLARRSATGVESETSGSRLPAQRAATLGPIMPGLPEMRVHGLALPEARAAAASLSPSFATCTVEWRMRGVFGELDISSRNQLRTALPDNTDDVAGKADARACAGEPIAQGVPAGGGPRRPTGRCAAPRS